MKKKLLVATLLLSLMLPLTLTGCNSDVQVPEGDSEAFQDMTNLYVVAMK